MNFKNLHIYVLICPDHFESTCTLRHADQVYSCERMSGSRLLTAADDEVHVWDLSLTDRQSRGFKFQNFDEAASENTFGGPRNADNKGVVIFDAYIYIYIYA